MWSSRREGFFNYQEAGSSIDAASMSSVTGSGMDFAAAFPPVSSSSMDFAAAFTPTPAPVTTNTLATAVETALKNAGGSMTVSSLESSLARLIPSNISFVNELKLMSFLTVSTNNQGQPVATLIGSTPVSSSVTAAFQPTSANTASTATTASTTKGSMSATYLQTLVAKIDEESIKLNALPKTAEGATDPTVIAKLNQLASMRFQIVDYITKLSASPPQIAIADIPITVEAADAFLRTLGTPTKSQGEYPGLFTTPSGSGSGSVGSTVTQGPTTSTSAGAGASAGANTGAIDGVNFVEGSISMFNKLQDIKWRYELSYDPALSQKTDLLNRLESLEKRIMAYAKEGIAIPDNVKQIFARELEILTSIIKPSSSAQQGASSGYKARQNTQHTRMNSAASYRSDGRTYSNPVPAYGGGSEDVGSYSLFDGVPRDSPDVRIRPGFVMTDDQIRRRASAAAFNTQAVGGPDYKKRSEDICRQIRGANIGTPADFGCIENPAEVSANYSWKGNYSMICSRLGDTWGSWYPGMFGCHETTPDDKYNGNLL